MNFPLNFPHEQSRSASLHGNISGLIYSWKRSRLRRGLANCDVCLRIIMQLTASQSPRWMDDNFRAVDALKWLVYTTRSAVEYLL